MELVVLLANLEIALRMRAYRAGSRSLETHDEVAAVAALPHGHFALLEDLSIPTLLSSAR